MATSKDSKKDKKKADNKTKAADIKDVNADNKDAGNNENAEDSVNSEQQSSAKKKDKVKEDGINTDNKADTEESLEEKLAEAKDKYLRLSAEFDNYRKRTLKEKMDLTKSAGESIINNLLPVMDDFDRALQLMEEVSDCKAMKDGIDLIYSKFSEFLKGNGVKEIDALNKEFDTDLHEAITKIPAPDKKSKGKVVDVIQKGYYLNDRVMRYAKVVIGE